MANPSHFSFIFGLFKQTLQVRVRIPLKPKNFFRKIVFEKNENKQKRGRAIRVFP